MMDDFSFDARFFVLLFLCRLITLIECFDVCQLNLMLYTYTACLFPYACCFLLIIHLSLSVLLIFPTLYCSLQIVLQYSFEIS